MASISPPSSPVQQSHPVYSDFSHIASTMGIGNTAFAVGLRESNPEELIDRILPLAKVVPGQKRERVIREKKKEEKICSKPECVARREIFQEMTHENEYLRVQFRVVEGRVAASRNRVALTEKSVDLAEGKNETLHAQIDEAQAKIVSIQAVVEKSELRNQAIRQQYGGILQEIENMKAQVDNYRMQTQRILDNDSGPRVVFQESRQLSNMDEVQAVSGLWNTEADSDSD